MSENQRKGAVAMKSDELMQVIMREPEGSARMLAAAEALIADCKLYLNTYIFKNL